MSRKVAHPPHLKKIENLQYLVRKLVFMDEKPLQEYDYSEMHHRKLLQIQRDVLKVQRSCIEVLMGVNVQLEEKMLRLSQKVREDLIEEAQDHLAPELDLDKSPPPKRRKRRRKSPPPADAEAPVATDSTTRPS